MSIRNIKIISSKHVAREFVIDGELLTEDDYLWPYRCARRMADWREEDFAGFFADVRKSFAEKEFLLTVSTSDEEYNLLKKHLPAKDFAIEKGSPHDCEIPEKQAETTQTPDAMHSTDGAQTPHIEEPLEDCDAVEKRMASMKEEECRCVFKFDRKMLEAEYARIQLERPDVRQIQTFFLRKKPVRANKVNYIIYVRAISNDNKLVRHGTVATEVLDTDLVSRENDFWIHVWRR